MINSFLPHAMEESESSNPNNTRLKPRSVLVYNGSMGAVDNVDKTVKPYQSVRKSFKWYKKVFFNLIDISIYNSFVIYMKITPRRKLAYKQFLKSVISEIHSCNPMERLPKGRPSTNTPDRLKGMHIPRRCINDKGVPSYSDCIYCKNYGNGKRKATSFQCKTCNVRLCIQGDRSCFELYHTEKKLTGNRLRNVPNIEQNWTDEHNLLDGSGLDMMEMDREILLEDLELLSL